MTIKRASLEDAAEILALQKLAYQSEAELHGDYGIPQLLQTLEQLRADLQSQLFLKAVVNGAVVGSVRARLDQDTCLVGRLMVHPSFQGRGIGTRLMSEIERNIRLYQKLGYRVFRRERVDDALELVYMEKSLDQPAAGYVAAKGSSGTNGRSDTEGRSG